MKRLLLFLLLLPVCASAQVKADFGSFGTSAAATVTAGNGGITNQHNYYQVNPVNGAIVFFGTNGHYRIVDPYGTTNEFYTNYWVLSMTNGHRMAWTNGDFYIDGSFHGDGSLFTGFTASQIPSLDASKITSGTLATARLGSGSATAGTFLRGDQTYATPPGSTGIATNGGSGQFNTLTNLVIVANSNGAVSVIITNLIGATTNLAEFWGTNGSSAFGPGAGLHIGGTSFAGTSNLLVEGTATANGGFSGSGLGLTSINPINLVSNLPLSKLAQGGAASGQVAEWNGSAWVPSDVQGVTVPTTITPTNFILNQKYTNTSGSVQLVDATVSLTTAIVSGQSSLSLYADQTGGTTFTIQDQAKITTVASAALTDYRNLIGALSNNAAYYFTNDSTGAGNTSAIVSGSGELITLTDGAAAGIASVGGVNAFTAQNTFSALTHMDSLVVTNGLTNSVLTGSRIVLSDANDKLVSAAASGAVPVDADGSATTSAQVQALFPGTILTNNHNAAITVSNNFTVDGAHQFSGNGAGVTNVWVKELLFGNLPAAIITTGARQVVMVGTASSSFVSGSSAAQFLMPVGGYLTNFQALSSVAWPATTNIIFTIQTNKWGASPVSTPLTCTLAPSGGSTYTNSGTTAAVLVGSQDPAGLMWSLNMNTTSPSGNIASQNTVWSIEWWHQSP